MDGSRLSVTKLLWPAATGVKSVVDGEEHNVAERKRERTKKKKSERKEKKRQKIEMTRKKKNNKGKKEGIKDTERLKTQLLYF